MRSIPVPFFIFKNRIFSKLGHSTLQRLQNLVETVVFCIKSLSFLIAVEFWDSNGKNENITWLKFLKRIRCEIVKKNYNRSIPIFTRHTLILKKACEFPNLSRINYFFLKAAGSNPAQGALSWIPWKIYCNLFLPTPSLNLY